MASPRMASLSQEFQSTLSLRRATVDMVMERLEALISIHALLAESDFRWKSWSRRLSTISIHALLAESDSLSIQMTRRKTNFNPRSPCGERPSARYPRLDSNQFQSTLSLRRATRVSPTPRDTRILFQSTLSLRRATQVWQYLADGPPYFNPRSPCGERQGRQHDHLQPPRFQSTLSLRRATVYRVCRRCGNR